MAQWLDGERIDALYTSPLRRARETADAVAGRCGLEPVVVDLLAEYDRHDSTYIPLEDLKALKRAGQPELWLELLAKGETAERSSWREEVASCVESLVAAGRGQKVLAVCHGGVINAYLTHVLRIVRAQVFEPVYTGINRVMAAGSGERTVITLNEAPWLRHLPPPAPTDS